MSKYLKDYWSSFREELVATSLVLVVAAGGSFFIINKMVNGQTITPPSDEAVRRAEMENQIAQATNQVLGIETAPTISVTPGLSPQPTLMLSPTSNPFNSELTYGTGGLYETEQYKLGISTPRIMFDARDMTSRKFVVDMTLTNKTVTNGLSNAITASIVKDGVVIVPNAAMSVSDAKVIMPSESVTYQGRLSLIEGTDVSLIRFSPSGLSPVEHVLRP
jgi:hypothetical protein